MTDDYDFDPQELADIGNDLGFSDDPFVIALERNEDGDV